MERLVSRDNMVKAIESGALIKNGLLNGNGFMRWLNDDSRSNHGYKLWLLFVLENWAQLWLLPNAERQS
jgi:hypothetical protein